MKNGHVHYWPWVGDLYRTEGLWGRRVLIVGESHYIWDEAHRSEATDPNFTHRCVEEACAGAPGTAFWTRIRYVLGGPEYRELPPSEFWDRVAFYNFLQVAIEGGARVRPTQEMFWDKRSQDAFYEVLNDIQPERIYVCGSELWRNLPEAEKERAARFERDGHAFEICLFRLESGTLVPATYTNHPQSASYPNSLHSGLEYFIKADVTQIERRAN